MTAISLNAPKLFDLSGNVAFVTGAGSGIGQRIAMGLAQCGADIALLDRRQDDGLAVTAEFVRKAGRKAIEIAADVTNKASLADAVARTEAELGLLSLAVNAAGIANANPAEEMEEDQYQTLMDINLKGVFLSSQAEAKSMLKRGKGAIVNIASMSGVIVNRGLAAVPLQCLQGRRDPHVEVDGHGVGGAQHPRQHHLARLYRDPDEHAAGNGAPDQALRRTDPDAAHGQCRRDGRPGRLPALGCRQLRDGRRPPGRWRLLLLVSGSMPARRPASNLSSQLAARSP